MAGIFDPGIFDSGIFDDSSAALTVSVPAAVVTVSAPVPGIGPPLTVSIPAAVVTVSGPAPALPSVIRVPAALITVTGPAPVPYSVGTTITVEIPAALITLSVHVTPAIRISVPAATVTLTASAPHSGILIAVPPAIVTLNAHPPYVTRAGAGIRTGPVRVFIGFHEILYPSLEAGLWTEEVLGGVSAAGLVVHDRTLTGFDPEPHEDVLITVRATGWVLFHGETIAPAFDIEPVREYPVWTISCAGYKLAERLVGAPNGNQYWRPNATEPYQPIDADAISAGNDQVTVRNWLDAYFRFPDGSAARTTTYVHNYVPGAFLGAEENIMWLYNATTDLQAALESLAAAAEDVNVQFGLWADDELYWLGIPDWRDLTAGGSQGDLPSSPIDFGTGGVSIRLKLSGTKDGSAMPEKLYVQGATTYVLADDGGTVVKGGSGWYPDLPWKYERQAYLGAPSAWSETNRNRIAGFAMRRAAHSTLRANLAINEANTGGLRPGMVANVSDPRLPGSMQNGSGTGRFVIQRVHTTVSHGIDPATGNPHNFATDIDIGDGAAARIGQWTTRQRVSTTAVGPLAQPPIVTWVTDWQDFGAIGSNETRTFVSTPVNGKGDPWGPPGMPITFVVHAHDSDGNVVLSEGSTDPVTTVTDQDGKARGTFSSSLTRDDLYYAIEVQSVQEPAV